MFGDLGGSEPDYWREHSEFSAARDSVKSMQKDINDGTVALHKGGAIFHIGTAARDAFARCIAIADSCRQRSQAHGR